MVSRRVFLECERILLRPLEEGDARGPYPEWFNDQEVCRGNSHHVYPYTMRDAEEYIRYARTTQDDLVLAIVLKEDGRHIGNIALQGIHPVYRSADLSLVIGDRAAWGNGYGKEACRTVCDHGFSALNLNRIACATFDTNEPMKHIARFLGMKEEGRRKEAAFKDGHFVDVVEFGVLAGDYRRKWAGKAPSGGTRHRPRRRPDHP